MMITMRVKSILILTILNLPEWLPSFSFLSFFIKPWLLTLYFFSSSSSVRHTSIKTFSLVNYMHKCTKLLTPTLRGARTYFISQTQGHQQYIKSTKLLFSTVQTLIIARENIWRHVKVTIVEDWLDFLYPLMRY